MEATEWSGVLCEILGASPDYCCRVVVQASGGLVFFGSCLGVGLLMAVRPVHSTASDFSSSCLLLLAMCVPPSVAGPVLSTAAASSYMDCIFAACGGRRVRARVFSVSRVKSLAVVPSAAVATCLGRLYLHRACVYNAPRLV